MRRIRIRFAHADTMSERDREPAVAAPTAGNAVNQATPSLVTDRLPSAAASSRAAGWRRPGRPVDAADAVAESGLPRNTVALHEDLGGLLLSLTQTLPAFLVRVWRPSGSESLNGDDAGIALIPPDRGLIAEIRRRRSDAVIIVVSVRGHDANDAACCLDVGADDYLHGSTAELAARIKALDRRHHGRGVEEDAVAARGADDSANRTNDLDRPHDTPAAAESEH